MASGDRVDQLKDVPTLKESGIDVEVTNWRGVVAPPGITKEQRQGLTDIVQKMVKTKAWQETLEREGWKSVVKVDEDYDTFLNDEVERVTGVIKQLGIGKVE